MWELTVASYFSVQRCSSVTCTAHVTGCDRDMMGTMAGVTVMAEVVVVRAVTMSAAGLLVPFNSLWSGSSPAR